MKKLLLATALLTIATTARAADVEIKFDEKSQQVAFQLPALLDQCVAGMTLRGDATLCKTLSGVLTAFSGVVSQSVKAAADAKAAADKAAAAKPVQAPTSETPAP